MGVEGDGDGGLVSAIAAHRADGLTGVLVWNSSLDQSRMPFDPVLDRDVTVVLSGLRPGRATVRHWRIDEEHSNVFAAWRRLGGDQDWPRSDSEWAQLRSADRLDELDQERVVEVAGDGSLELAFVLPHPGISYVSVVSDGGR